VTTPNEGGHGVGRTFAHVAESIAVFGAICLFLYRWHLGRPILRFADRRPTDAKFWRRATKQYREQDRLTLWAFLPEGVRAFIRVYPTELEPLAYWYSHTSGPWGVAAWMFFWGSPVALIGYILYGGWVWWKLRAHRKAVVHPIRAAVALRVGQSPTKPAEKWLEVPPDYKTNVANPVVVHLPQGFDREQHGSKLEKATLERLQLAEHQVTWHNYGDNPTVSFGLRPAPPRFVGLDMVMHALDGLPSDKLILGMGRGEKVVSVSLEVDSPHMSISAPSNSGKSATGGFAIAQQLYKGAAAVILDTRAESHTWAFNLPNAVVFTQIDKVHSALVAVEDEFRRRQALVEQEVRAGRARPPFPRLWVLFEEMNITTPALIQYWAGYRNRIRLEDPEEYKKLPAKSPAVSAQGNVSFAGRSVNVHGIYVAQRLTAASTGDTTGAVRENMGIRYMIKPRPSTWKMLADGASFPDFIRGGITGHAFVVINGEQEEVQGAYATDPELAELSISGEVCPVPGQFRAIEAGSLVMVGGQAGHGHSSGHTIDADSPTGDRPALPYRMAVQTVDTQAPVLVTVDQAVADGALGGNPESLKRALRRDRDKGTAPEPQDGPNGSQLYDLEALRAWHENRPRADRRLTVVQ
jgi:hypothetical protein